MSRADLTGIDLSGAYLSFANLEGARLRAEWVLSTQGHTASTEGIRANLRGARLFAANLSRASPREANLSGAFLSQANLSHAHLDHANFHGADLLGANLTGASLHSAEIWEANFEPSLVDGLQGVEFAGGLSSIGWARDVVLRSCDALAGDGLARRLAMDVDLRGHPP